MPDVSPIQLIIVLIIALVILGPKRLPEVGRSLGRGIREFKDSVTGNEKDEETQPPPTPAATIAPPPPPAEPQQPAYTATQSDQAPRSE